MVTGSQGIDQPALHEGRQLGQDRCAGHARLEILSGYQIPFDLHRFKEGEGHLGMVFA